MRLSGKIVLITGSGSGIGRQLADEFFQTLAEQEEVFAAGLNQHIGKHLELLGK